MKNIAYIRSLLADDILQGETQSAQKILEENPELDVVYKDGYFFGLATVAKTGSPEMLELLIDYYKKTKMQGEVWSAEYQDAKELLLDILEREGDWSNVPPAIKAAIDKYLHENDTDIEFDPEDFGASNPPSDQEDDGSVAMASAHDSDHQILPLTKHNLEALNRISSTTSTDDEGVNSHPAFAADFSNALAEPQPNHNAAVKLSGDSDGD